MNCWVSTVLNRKRRAITQDLYDKVLNAIQLDSRIKCDDGAKFKHWCKNQFKVETIGARNLLYCIKTLLPVTTKEDTFDTILRCHLRVGHTGRDKTFDEVKNNYSWVNRNVQLFLQTCPTCNTRQPLKKPKVGKLVISLGFLTRVQVDLIDMKTDLMKTTKGSFMQETTSPNTAGPTL